MKKIFTVLAVAAIVVACSKEKESFFKPVSGDTIFLRADIPAMTDITKATADGSFSWAEDDEIAVPIDGGYAVFQYKTAQSAFTYTPNGTETFINGTVYYPASSRPSGSYSTAFASQDAARAGFKMEAAYTAGASSLTFTHVSSLIKLSFNNVPSFATSVAVKEGDDVVATVALPSPAPSSVEVKVPVTPNGSKAYSFELLEGTNVLRGATKTVSLTAGTYYTSPAISVNNYVMFTGSSNDTHRIGLLKRNYDGTEVGGTWTTHDLHKLANGDKYIMLPDTYAEAEAIQVELRQNDGGDEYKKSETSYVLPVRNLVFDTSENTLKMAYRCYAKFTDGQWGYWIAQGSGTDKVKFRWDYGKRPDPSGTDADCTEVTVASGKLFYYEFPASMYGYDNVYWGFYNPENTAWVGNWDNATINRDMLKNL